MFKELFDFISVAFVVMFVLSRGLFSFLRAFWSLGHGISITMEEMSALSKRLAGGKSEQTTPQRFFKR